MARFINDRKKSIGKSPGALIHLGTKKIDRPRLSLLHYTPDELVEKEPETLEECLSSISEDSVTWINIDGLHDAELIQNLGKLFKIHDILLEDMLDTGQRPKVAETDELIAKNMRNHADKLLAFNQCLESPSMSSASISFLIQLKNIHQRPKKTTSPAGAANSTFQVFKSIKKD